MKWYGFILAGLCLAGCMSNKGLETDTVSENNRYRLSKVRKGMYEAQVLSIMRQPYQYETFELGKDVYDVWFYITNPTVLGQSRMVAQNLTPLSFKNGVLVGTGYDYYYYITREMAKQSAAEAPPPQPKTPLVEPRPPSKEIEPQQTPKQKPAAQENKELEESLQKAAKPTAPAQPARPQKAAKPAPAAPESESLQPEPKPTAPIVSFAEPLVERKTLFSLLAAKNPLSKVRKGMSETEVQQIMGAPVDAQSFDLGEDRYDVWFYETKNSNSRTPLTFKNGFLVGTTSDYYNGIKQAASHDQVDGYDKEAERMQQDESEQNFDYW